MPVSINNTTLTFNDATTQTTAGTSNTLSAGTGISVSSPTGASTIANTGVTSVAAGTGISVSASTGGVTITNSNPNQLTTTTGSPAYFGARAWVNFNGTGTPAINASVNVSSITDNGTGDYTVNFTTAMPDGNYSLTANGKLSTFGNNDGCITRLLRNSNTPMTTGSARILTGPQSNANNLEDPPIVTVTIHR
jgi:hypothetical protein